AGSEEQAREAFSETMYKFWQKFVVEGNELPKTNIKGYIFTMVKYYLIDEQRRKSKHRTVSDEGLSNTEATYMKTESDFWQEQELDDLQQQALKQAIQKMGTKCQEIFHLMLKKGLEKPRDLWKPLGYNNARTLSTVKSGCLKKLKLKAVLELEFITTSNTK
ncbi:MAG: sigma-70 family RNA polymerase sigma factor, partial [Bacteroidota bacterium]